MAGGEGGFSTKAMGFDKKEVNDYIANLNQRMKEIEAEKKTNDEKTQAALKKAQDADKTIKSIKDESDKKIADLELQLKTERKNEENLLIQIDELKRKLKNKGSGAAAEGGSTKAAEAKSAEIIAKANATAKDIVDKANSTARDTVEKAKATATRMVSQASGSAGGGVSTAGLDEFMKVLSAFADNVTNGLNEVNSKASELLNAPAAEPVTVPDFSNIEAPQAEAPAAEAPKAKSASKAAKAAETTDDLFAFLEEEENTSSSDDDLDDMVTEVQPLDDPSSAPGAVVLDEFDLSQPMDLDFDEPISEVAPINTKKQGKPDLSEDFEKQILAQTANSSSLKNVMDDELLEAVRLQEEQFAVKPAEESLGDLDMDAEEDEDPLAAMLRQAEIAFGGSSGSSVVEEEEESSAAEESGSGEDNPWAALQNELMAMEKSGDLAESDSSSDTEISTDTSVPDADDSAIWDFGDSSSGSDDDDMGMSSDLFGSF